MNTETAKNYLNQYRNAVANLQDKREELNKLYYNIGIQSSGIDTNKVQFSPRPDKIERQAIEIAELEKEIEILEKIAAEIKKDTIETIKLVPDWRLRRILLYRYILDKNWQSIAQSIGRTYKHTVNVLHKKALLSLIKVNRYKKV